MKSLLRITLYALLPSLLFATTWSPVEKKCPICGTKSVYYEIMSYGSYVYDYPSRFEYIFWPYTDGKALYSCRKCWFTCFMWDFEDIPESKRKDIRKFVDSLDLYETNGDYNVIPMSYRLLLAERIYEMLDKDDEFWCHFYRVKGHHLANEEKVAHAAEARTKALNIAEGMLQDEGKKGIRKELYIITGAMRYCLNDVQGARQDFKRAKELTFGNENWNKESLKNINIYLSNLVDDYLEKISEKEDKAVFSTMPTIAEVYKEPGVFVDSMVTVTGILVNQGTGYFKDFKPALKDNLGNVLPVTVWAPLELPPPLNPDLTPPKVMDSYLEKEIRAGGYFRMDDTDRFEGDYYLEVFDVHIVEDK
jgi:hypothetical protein